MFFFPNSIVVVASIENMNMGKHSWYCLAVVSSHKYTYRKHHESRYKKNEIVIISEGFCLFLLLPIKFRFVQFHLIKIYAAVVFRDGNKQRAFANVIQIIISN